MWNWNTRLFLTEARINLTAAEEGSLSYKHTKEELDGLERTLIDHEKWLNEWVEKQKSVKMNEDPVILSSEMRARAKTLENHLQRLVKKKTPRPLKKSTSTQATETSGASQESSETAEASSSSTSPTPSAEDLPPVNHDEL